VTIPKYSRGDSTIEPDVRTVKVNVRGCDFDAGASPSKLKNQAWKQGYDISS
jgi:hypothetical protein